jgi:hypothetical protein
LSASEAGMPPMTFRPIQRNLPVSKGKFLTEHIPKCHPWHFGVKLLVFKTNIPLRKYPQTEFRAEISSVFGKRFNLLLLQNQARNHLN